MARSLYDTTLLEPLIEEGCVLLTPNFRLARRIKAEWDNRCKASGQLVWEPLRIKPLESWLLEQWELAVSLDLLSPTMPLGPNQVQELWRQVIRQQEGESSDYHLLRPSAAAELAGQARDVLQRWQVDMGDRNLRQGFELDRDCATFLSWLTLFEQRLNAAGQCTPVDCLTQLLSIPGKLPRTQVALIAIEELSPLEQSVLEALGACVREVRSGVHRTEPRTYSFSDKRAELAAVAKWAADLHRIDPQSTIGIVLSGMGVDRSTLEYLLRREFECLGENYTSLPVNFSAGIALAQAPLIRDALSTLAMGLQDTTVPAVVSLLHSRFLDLPDAHSALANKFISSLFKNGIETLGISDLRFSATQVSLGEERGLILGQHLRAMADMRQLRRNGLPSAWAECFREILSIWGWPGKQGLDSLEYQQWESWNRLLETFKSFDSVCSAVNYGEALQLLRDSCHRQVSQPQTEDSPVQVLGPLEAVGLEFDHLWICGMQAASWPASPHPNPFIPVTLQAARHMPHATPEREWAFSETLLNQYRAACSHLYASYSRQLDGVPELPSALLDGTEFDAGVEQTLVAPQWESTFNLNTVELLSDTNAPGIPRVALTEITGGSGLLEDQSQCPFRAFSRHRLQVEPLGTFTVALSAAERGSLLHDALRALWGDIGNHAELQALTEDQQHQAVVRAVQVASANFPESLRRKMSIAYWQLEGQRLASLLNEWLETERQRSPFVVIQREQEMSLELAGFRVQLRIDRVDQLPDGSKVIVDYKSGAGKVQDWFGERPAKPQLLLYAIAEPEAAAAVAFAQVRARDCRYIGLGRVAAAPGITTDIARAAKLQAGPQDWESLNTQWRENLERLAHDYIAGAAAVDPLGASSCTWCGLQSLCRIDYQVEAQEDDVE